MELSEYLREYGWLEAEIDAIEEAYTGGPDWEPAVKAVVAWMDDEEHDYSGEAVDCVKKWRREVGEDHGS